MRFAEIERWNGNDNAEMPSLAAVMTHLFESRRSVLWLDDLERFLGPGGMTPAMVPT